MNPRSKPIGQQRIGVSTVNGMRRWRIHSGRLIRNITNSRRGPTQRRCCDCQAPTSAREPWSGDPHRICRAPNPIGRQTVEGGKHRRVGACGAGPGNTSPTSSLPGATVRNKVSAGGKRKESRIKDWHGNVLSHIRRDPGKKECRSPLGATSSMSRSSGNSCARSWSVKTKLVIGPFIPETLIYDGYGSAAPRSG